MLIVAVIVVVLVAGFIGYRALMRDPKPKQATTPDTPKVEAVPAELPPAEAPPMAEAAAEPVAEPATEDAPPSDPRA